MTDCLYQPIPDCLHVEKAKLLGTGGEAPAIFKHDGVYYLLASHLTGLNVSDNFNHTATNIWGPWQAKGRIAQGEHSAKTFMTQTTDVVPVAGKNGAFIWLGDSIRGANNITYTTRTVWLPVTLKANGEMEIRWRDSWDLSLFDGQAWWLRDPQRRIVAGSDEERYLCLDFHGPEFRRHVLRDSGMITPTSSYEEEYPW